MSLSPRLHLNLLTRYRYSFFLIITRKGDSTLSLSNLSFCLKLILEFSWVLHLQAFFICSILFVLHCTLTESCFAVMKTTIFLLIQKRMNSAKKKKISFLFFFFAKSLESKVHLYVGWLDLEHRSAEE